MAKASSDSNGQGVRAEGRTGMIQSTGSVNAGNGIFLGCLVIPAVLSLIPTCSMSACIRVAVYTLDREGRAPDSVHVD